MKKLFVILTLAIGLIGCGSKVEEPKSQVTKEGSVSVKEVQKAEKDKNIVLMDTRSYDEYNGWDLDGKGVNGHIPGSVNYPTSAIKDGDVEKALERKGIVAGNEIILYGKESKTMAAALTEKGYTVSIFDGGVEKWAENSLSFEKLKRYETIVPVSWVKDLLDGKKVNHYDGRPVKVFNVGWGEKGKSHKEGHIPGSYWMHTGWVEEGPLWNRVDDMKIKTEMEKQGITTDTLVLIYGDPMAAARFGVIAKYAGVEDVRMINGGLKGWKEAGYPVETEMKTPESVKEFGAEVPQNPEIIVDLPEAVELLKAEDGDLISIRSWREYLGKISGYDYIKPRGRIEGAKWGMAGSDPWHLEDYRGMDQFHMRPYTEIQKMWEGLKINSENHLAFYCGTGWRASEVWFYAQAMGLERISVYDGGWKEWSETKETKKKVLKGEPKVLNEESFVD
ncbi:rhodanese-like domain-containing protein [Fusobacteria bacterium ZRK30]|nr:rhodanese-like domain-containing protein [Fusobacteria bacterium ZRK30]